MLVGDYMKELLRKNGDIHEIIAANIKESKNDTS